MEGERIQQLGKLLLYEFYLCVYVVQQRRPDLQHLTPQQPVSVRIRLDCWVFLLHRDFAYTTEFVHGSESCDYLFESCLH